MLKAIGLTDAEAESTVRFSLGRFVTASDVDEAVRYVAEAMSRLSGHAQYQGELAESG